MDHMQDTDRVKSARATDVMGGRIRFDALKAGWLGLHGILGVVAVLFFFS